MSNGAGPQEMRASAWASADSAELVGAFEPR